MMLTVKNLSNDWELIDNVEIDGINLNDFPDFCDAFISYAIWLNSGKELTSAELEHVNNQSDIVYSAVLNWIY